MHNGGTDALNPADRPPDRSPGRPDPSPAPAPDTAAAASLLRSRLEGLRRRAWLLLVAQRAGLVLALAILALVVGALLDYALRAPEWLRTLGLAAALGSFLWAVAALIRPALRFRPSLTELALRVEHADPGKAAKLTDLLAAGLELAGRSSTFGDRRLAAPVVIAASERVKTLRARHFLAPARTINALALCALAAVIVLGFGASQPELTRTGIERMLWPWGGAEWPKRTGIADATSTRIHPLGTALALRAALTKHQGPASAARVEARYRLITDGRAGPWQRALLTSQDREIHVGLPDGSVSSGALFERLIEPKNLLPERDTPASADVALEYALASDDDQTPAERIALVEPPAVLRASAEVTPPSYLASPADPSAPASLDLGAGIDERAVPAPMLAGSRIALAIDLNKPLPLPPQDNPFAWAARTLGPDAAALLASGASLTTAESGSRWVLRWTLDQSVRLAVRPVDEHGIAAVDEAAFRIEALTDKPPSATVTAPAEDKSVLATALVETAGEARDDVGLEYVALQTQVARIPAESEGAAPEPVGEPREWARTPSTPDESGGPAKRLTALFPLDLSAFEPPLKPGDEVWVSALAADTYALAGARHDPVRSSIRRLRVLSREELIEQVWNELSSVRRTAIKIDEDQEQTSKSSQRPGVESARQSERAQVGISERIARQADSLRRIQQRLDENALADASLNQTVRDSRDALARAGQQSVSASSALADSAKAQSAEEPAPTAGQEERARAADAQESVRDELAGLIDLLDQGEDTFASKRSLERLIQQQKDLRERTAEAASETAGKSLDQLSPEQRQTLEQIAQEQKAAADALREAVRRMHERESKLAKSDPAAAQAMAQAARRAERDQVAQKMEQASQQAQKNQVGAAQQQQSSAQQSLEQMLQDLDQAQNTRDEVLRRFLASLIDSIDGLIQLQTTHLRALTDRLAGADLTGLDAPMAVLHQNTLGVVDQAAQGPRQLAPVAKLLAEAADAQSSAVVSLRSSPPAGPDAQTHEQLSLTRLQEARAEAEKIDQQAEERQQDRKRDALRRQYQEFLDRQASIKDAADGLAQQEASRRTRAAARQLAGEQTTLKNDIATLRRDNPDLAQAAVFDYAHTRLDSLLSEAATTLESGEANANVIRRQASAVRLLRSLVEALAEQKRKDDFRESESSAGGGGGSPNQRQPLVPPAAELLLLKSLQQEAADSTRAAGDAPDPDLLHQAGALQRDVADQARDLMERLKREQEGGGPGAAPVPEKKEGGQ